MVNPFICRRPAGAPTSRASCAVGRGERRPQRALTPVPVLRIWPGAVTKNPPISGRVPRDDMRRKLRHLRPLNPIQRIPETGRLALSCWMGYGWLRVHEKEDGLVFRGSQEVFHTLSRNFSRSLSIAAYTQKTNHATNQKKAITHRSGVMVSHPPKTSSHPTTISMANHLKRLFIAQRFQNRPTSL